MPAFVAHDREQPGPQVRTWAEPAEMSPGVEHSLLHSVLGVRFRSKHADGKPERVREQGLDEEHERLLVAAAGVLDERRGAIHLTRTIRRPGQKSRPGATRLPAGSSKTRSWLPSDRGQRVHLAMSEPA